MARIPDEPTLQDPQEWDWGGTVRSTANRTTRVILSVAFSNDEMAIVARAAEAKRQRVSTFVRDAAIQAARSTGTVPVNLGPVTATTPTQLYSAYVRVFSGAAGGQLQITEEKIQVK